MPLIGTLDTSISLFRGDGNIKKTKFFEGNLPRERDNRHWKD